MGASSSRRSYRRPSAMDRYDRRMRGRSGHMWWGTVLESPGPAAAFYSRLLSWPVVHQEPGRPVVKPPQEPVFKVFQLAEDYVRPAWPPVTGQQRTMMHLDVQVDDLGAGVADAASDVDWRTAMEIR
jgi:Glyoxalase-like domain